MTDREKAFVMNGMRNYGRVLDLAAGLDPDDIDRRLAEVAKALRIDRELLEEVRRDQQELVLTIIKLTGGDIFNGP